MHQSIFHWNKLCKVAEKNLKGAKILGRKYPKNMATEAKKLHKHYEKAYRHLLIERADLQREEIAVKKKPNERCCYLV